MELSKDNIISRSHQLIESRFPTWDAATLNIFDTYLSKINPLDPSSSEVVFTKREYEKLLGVKEMRPDQLAKCIRKFMGNTVLIPKDNGGWKICCLFDMADMDKLPNGEWQITLRCHPALQSMFFALKGYQKYKLATILDLGSKYSKLLYYNLRNHQFRNEWKVGFLELKEIIGADKDSYASYRNFNKLILKKAVAEINENTELDVRYKGIYCGKSVSSILFEISLKPNTEKLQKECDNKTKEIPDVEMHADEKENDFENEILKFYSDACDNEFNENQIREMSLLAAQHVPEGLPVDEFQNEVYKYLNRKYIRLKNRKGVSSPYGYLLYLVEHDK